MSATNFTIAHLYPHLCHPRGDRQGGKGEINNATLTSVHLFCDDQRASDGALRRSFLSFSFHTDEAGVLRGARPSI
jgi:hypothetical protein